MKTLDKIQSVVKVFKILTKVAFVCVIVGTILAFVASLTLFIPQLQMLQKYFISFSSNNASMSDVQHGAVIIAIALELMLTAILLSGASSTFKCELEAGTPFNELVIKKVRVLGILCLVFPIVSIAATKGIYASVALTYPNDYSVVGSASFGIGLILFSLILKYGSELEEKLFAE